MQAAVSFIDDGIEGLSDWIDRLSFLPFYELRSVGLMTKLSWNKS